MATTTPNFGWSVPTSTDLVKDGATAIETLGDAIDASLVDLKGGTSGQVLKKNSNTDMDFIWSADSAGMTNPMTTTGDTIYSSSGSTPARLGIGSTGQVLTVAGGIPSWATASGDYKLVTRASFSNVANTGTSFDGVFTSTYKSYQIVIESIYAATSSDDLHFQFRYAGPTTQAALYYSNCISVNAGSSSVSNAPVNNGSAATIATRIGDTTDQGAGVIFAYKVSGSSAKPSINGSFIDVSNSDFFTFSGTAYEARVYTGFIMKSSSSNITGTVSVYGLV
jgi:hypothetical protein